MPINFPTNQQEIFDRVISDFQNQIPNAGPFIRNNFVYAILAAYSARIFDNYQILQQLLKQLFPDTATDEYLTRWGGYVGVTPLEATRARGNITFTGLVNSSIPINTQVQTTSGNIYETRSAAVIAAQTYNINTLTRSGNTVTATGTGNHNFASGIQVSIAGATQSEYNGVYSIIVTGDNTFIYNISGSPATPATTGSQITATFFGVSVEVESLDSSSTANLDNGMLLSLLTPLTGVDQNSYVQFGGITGGTDRESDTRYRSRVIYKYQNPVALFNTAAITDKVKEVAQVSRVFVKEVTPSIGSVTVYFTVNGSNQIPTSTDVAQVKEKLLTIKPAHVDDSDVYVIAPTPVSCNFSISGLLPNTVTMQNAIKASLTDLFLEGTEVGEDLLEAAYLSAIYQTVDLSNGDTVRGFNITNFSGDIAIDEGELAVLGNVVFS